MLTSVFQVTKFGIHEFTTWANLEILNFCNFFVVSINSVTPA